MSKILDSREIGGQVRAMRLRAGFTQERLAEALGITPQQVQKYESGANKLNTDRLQQMATIFNVPVQSFFEQDEEVLPLEASEKFLLVSYRAIGNKDIQESFLKILACASKAKD